MKNNKKLLLVHAAMNKVMPEESVNVMLTPQFYTLKKEDLPLKYAYQAKKIAPSLFEGLLEDGSEYEYTVSKDGDSWIFMAYDMDKVMDFLSYKGIEPTKVSKIFFAQQSVNSFAKDSLILSDTEALTVIDDTVVVVPRSVLPMEEEGYPVSVFNNSFTPKNTNGVSPKKSKTESLLTQKQTLFLSGIFMLFAGMFLVEGLRYSSADTKDEEEKIQEIYDQNPALQSTYTRQDTIDKYKVIDKKERKKRDAVKAFSRMIFKGVTLTSLQVNEKKFTAQFSCTNDEVANRLKVLAKKAQYNISKAKGSNTLHIEGTL